MTRFFSLRPVRASALGVSLLVMASCNLLSQSDDNPSSDVTDDGAVDASVDATDVELDDPSVDATDVEPVDPSVDINDDTAVDTSVDVDDASDASETSPDVVIECGDGVCGTGERASCPVDCGIWGQSNWNQANWQ